MSSNTLETQSLEYKESWQDDCLRTICAFANADGGVLEIGKNDMESREFKIVVEKEVLNE